MLRVRKEKINKEWKKGKKMIKVAIDSGVSFSVVIMIWICLLQVRLNTQDKREP